MSEDFFHHFVKLNRFLHEEEMSSVVDDLKRNVRDLGGDEEQGGELTLMLVFVGPRC